MHSKKTMRPLTLFILLLMSLMACSTKQAYEAIQLKQKNDCQTLQGSEYEECMQRAEQSYEKYKEQRESVMKE